MLCYVYTSLEAAKESIDFLNSYWGFNTTNPTTSKFSVDSLYTFESMYLLPFHPNWTFILGTPVNIITLD